MDQTVIHQVSVLASQSHDEVLGWVGKFALHSDSWDKLQALTVAEGLKTAQARLRLRTSSR